MSNNRNANRRNFIGKVTGAAALMGVLLSSTRQKQMRHREFFQEMQPIPMPGSTESRVNTEWCSIALNQKKYFLLPGQKFIS